MKRVSGSLTIFVAVRHTCTTIPAAVFSKQIQMKVAGLNPVLRLGLVPAWVSLEVLQFLSTVQKH